MTRWILISDASRARFFQTDDNARTFRLLGTLEHPESRARVRDLMADANGRKPAGVPTVGRDGLRPSSLPRPGAVPNTDPKSVEALKFARQLAARLEAGLSSHAYDSVVIAAPPHFLGVLRQCLSDETRKHVELALNKDLTRTQKADIESHVRTELSL